MDIILTEFPYVNFCCCGSVFFLLVCLFVFFFSKFTA